MKEWLKEAARFGPAVDAPLKKVRTGWRRRTEDGVQSIDIAKSDEHSFTKHSAISPLADIVLGKGYDYNPANTFGEPIWWVWRLGSQSRFGVPDWWAPNESGPRYGDRGGYRGEERRWVLYSLGFRRRNWSHAQGEAAEARGVEIAATLQGESHDVRRVASWLRDGWTRVPPRATRQITRERVDAAMGRLKKLGLLKQIGKAFRVQ